MWPGGYLKGFSTLRTSRAVYAKSPETTTEEAQWRRARQMVREAQTQQTDDHFRISLLEMPETYPLTISAGAAYTHLK